MNAAAQMREAMGRLSELSAQWCGAYDTDDQEALQHLSEMANECLQEITALSTILQRAQKADQGT